MVCQRYDPYLQITLETAIRVRPDADVPDRQEYIIKFEVESVDPTSPAGNTHTGSLTQVLELKTPTPGDIPTTAVAAADVALVANITSGGVSPVPISTAEKKWLRFVVTLPKYTVAPVTVSMNQFQVKD